MFLPGESHGQRSLAGYIQLMGLQRVRHRWVTKPSQNNNSELILKKKLKHIILNTSLTYMYLIYTGLPHKQWHKDFSYLAGLWYWQRKSNLSSGTGTLLSFGSIVQNGKFSAEAWLLVSTLKKVDFLKGIKTISIFRLTQKNLSYSNFNVQIKSMRIIKTICGKRGIHFH